jgi:DNA-directed RNA polymerase specialized sigma24 family protein
MNEVTEYFTRWEHGNDPVRVVLKQDSDVSYILSRNGSEEIYTTVADLLTSILGRDYKNISFDRYFRTGSYEREPEVNESDWEIFSQAPVVKGIDLTKRGHEVRKILIARFGAWIKSGGYDPEDVLQEVYAGILTRNQGKCPFDETKSSFGHYVFMVCKGVLSNYHRKNKKRSDNEVLGSYPPSETSGHDHMVDVASSNSESMSVDGYVDSDDLAMARFVGYIERHSDNTLLKTHSIQILPMVLKGFRKSEISKSTGWSLSKTGKVMEHIRKCARKWMD